ncbi:MAG TPA: heparan-alpha-glucosaminide N-acetyltransferase domain-containing protein [Bryobacteraceae bacterium]|nr:heparan-alpha-glucosaminide N-acetyltransferase domain-containing protein [Bryobacteraceae bacterium]
MQSRRLQSVDALRGFVMVIMALDHTREYFHSAAQQFQPEDLARTTAAIFLTRWITHFCAPVFLFTAGIGAYYWMMRGRTRAGLSRYLAKRGLWLILLELTVLRLAFTFNVLAGPVLLTILWAIGWSMIALAFLAWLPVRWLAVVSIAGIALHNLADPVRGGSFWMVLHRQGLIHLAGLPVIVAYPLIPWMFVMSAGFCFAPLVANRRLLLRLGMALTLAFVLLRALNVYGDLRPWLQYTPHAWLSFLNTTKYPPSLDFLLMTLGPALLLLAFFESRPMEKNPLLIYGRAPLFYFLAHLFLIHLLTILFAVVRYGPAGFVLDPQASKLPQYGYSLAVVYAIWAMVVALMYPACRWYERIRPSSANLKAWRASRSAAFASYRSAASPRPPRPGTSPTSGMA